MFVYLIAQIKNQQKGFREWNLSRRIEYMTYMASKTSPCLRFNVGVAQEGGESSEEDIGHNTNRPGVTENIVGDCDAKHQDTHYPTNKHTFVAGAGFVDDIVILDAI